MKIGLITIVNGTSFGNRLQNYATQCIFEKLGYEVETIDNRFEKNSATKLKIQSIISPIFKYILHNKDKAINWRRGYAFLLWDEKYIKYSKVSVDSSITESFSRLENYDFLVVGSDQIWNPKFSANKGFELLSFAPAEKRLSLSTSIGVDNIPDELIPMYRKEWKKFKAISVREEKAKELIKSVSGMNADVNIDPTLMLTRAEWENFEVNPQNNLPNDYLLKFFLTCPSEEVENEIDSFAHNHKLSVVNLNKMYDGFENLTPNEFVYIISHSRMVCTDSFHCTVFSLIYGKSLCVFDRFDDDKVNSRLQTLLNTVQRELFWVGRNVDFNLLEKNYKEINYDIEDDLKDERNRVNKFILDNIRK